MATIRVVRVQDCDSYLNRKVSFELLYGRQARLPIVMSVPLIAHVTKQMAVNKFCSLAKETICHSQAQAKEAIRAAQNRQKLQYDKRVTVGELEIGDRVMLYSPIVRKGRSSKFVKPWTGPYLVLRKLHYPPLNYLTRNETSGGVQFAQRNRLKLIGAPSCSESAESPLDFSPISHQESEESDDVNIADVFHDGPRDGHMVEDQDENTEPQMTPHGTELPDVREDPDAGALTPAVVAPDQQAVEERNEAPGRARITDVGYTHVDRPRRAHRSPIRYADEYSLCSGRKKNK